MDFLTPPPWISYVNLAAIAVVAFFVWLLWRSVRRLWQRDHGFDDISASLLHLTSRLNSVERDVQNIRHDVNAVGHTVQAMQETIGTDIVESEERIVAKLDKMMQAQGVLLQQISTRPCIVREDEARDDSCPGDE